MTLAAFWRGQTIGADAKLLASWLVTGPASNRIGAFCFDALDAARDTLLDLARIEAAMDELANASLVRRDLDNGWIWIPQALTDTPFDDEDEVRASVPLLAAVPRECNFRDELVRAFRSSGGDRPGRAGAMPLIERIDRWVRRLLPGLPARTDDDIERSRVRAERLHALLAPWRSYLRQVTDTKMIRALFLILCLSSLFFVVVPGVDLHVAGWFYRGDHEFLTTNSVVARIFDTVPAAIEWGLAVVLLLFAWGEIRRAHLWRLSRPLLLFVALTIAIGPGLVANAVLKNNWGRARPHQIAEFGGTKRFSPAWAVSDQCPKNCSFVSGDASFAVALVAFAWAWPAGVQRRRWAWRIGSFAALVALMRMARGAHFLSDTVIGILLTLLVMLVLERLIFQGWWARRPGGSTA
ncbi:MAG: Phosphoesterase, PA-phosphatase related protein [Rhodospirillales bacterium]|nr:Phosphoesterase, PA-phosphatase related protein [Rhodospirillales bacterium]